MRYQQGPRMARLARRRKVRLGRRGFLGLGLAAMFGAGWWRGAVPRPGRGRWVLRKDDV